MKDWQHTQEKSLSFDWILSEFSHRLNQTKIVFCCLKYIYSSQKWMFYFFKIPLISVSHRIFELICSRCFFLWVISHKCLKSELLKHSTIYAGQMLRTKEPQQHSAQHHIPNVETNSFIGTGIICESVHENTNVHSLSGSKPLSSDLLINRELWSVFHSFVYSITFMTLSFKTLFTTSEFTKWKAE